MVLLAILAWAGWPNRPAPVSSAEAWAVRAGPAIDTLAADLDTAVGQSVVSPAAADRLQRDLARLQRAGPPPDRPRADVWARTISDVEAALRDSSDPRAAMVDLQVAALDITGLSAAQPQSRGAAGPNVPDAGAAPFDSVASAVELT